MAQRVLHHRVGGCGCLSSASSRKRDLPGPCGLRTATNRGHTLRCASSSTLQASVQEKNIEYNNVMRKRMGWEDKPFEYHFNDGLYYHEVHPGVFCGTQPRNPEEVSQLRRDLGITTIVNAQDFDPDSTRRTIPGAVQAIHQAVSSGGRVYVHCTAGLGRAPAVCIGYIYWFTMMTLDEAYSHLTSIRPCGPNKDAIRGATYDVLSSRPFDEFSHLPKDSFAVLQEEDKYALQYRVAKYSTHG